MKICLISSSGGHLSQLKELLPIVKDYEIFIITEKNDTTLNLKDKYKLRYLKQQNRKSFSFIPTLVSNLLLSAIYYLKERPDIVISTGAGACIPTLLLGKLLRSKIIFIESIAKIDTPTISGKIVYKFADAFYVQSEKLLSHYPRGKYKGTIY
jgi:beta-1,4-N-acetylglucosaminyltransferase